MKACLDCKFCEEQRDKTGRPTPPREWIGCTRVPFIPSNQSLVTGDFSKPVYKHCGAQRAGGWLTARLFGLCGREARFFEARENAP